MAGIARSPREEPLAGEAPGRGLRILLVSKFFWPAEGGQSTVLRGLVEAWSAAGHRVTVLTTRSEPDYPVDENVGGGTVHRIPVSFARLVGTPGLFARVSLWVRRHADDFDVACVSMLKHCAVATLLSARRNGLPVVIKTEGSGPTGDVAWQQHAPFGRWIRRRCWQASAVVAISREIERELLAAGAEPARTHFVPNGVAIADRPWVAGETSRFREQLGLQEMATLCYTGRFLPLKGLSDLVRAHARLEETRGPCQLLLIGMGPERPALEQLARQLGTEERVRFSGQVLDVEPYLRASDLYVLPSYVEGMSMSLLEALGLGMPALATDIEANRDLVPLELLPLAPVRDPRALAARIAERLDDDPDSARRCRELVRQKFGIERVAEQYVRMFTRLIGDRTIADRTSRRHA